MMVINMKKAFSGKLLITFFLVFSLLFSLALPCFAATPVSSASAAKRFSAGLYHCLAVKPDGTVAAWGYNEYGETTVPAGLTGVVAVSAGFYHSLALKSDGTVVAWGLNGNGQTTIPPGLTGVIAISAGAYFSLALKSDGTVVGWGDNGCGQTTIPPGLSGVKAISAGGFFSLVLKSNGSVVAWGDNSSGQVTPPAGLSGVVAISAGESFSLALKSNGTIVAWGANGFGQTTVPSGLSNVVGISGGLYHCLALRSNGTVVAWGANFAGQIDVPPSLADVAGVSAGGGFSVALKSDGTLVAWGNNNYGQSTPPEGLNLAWGRLSGLSVSQGVLSLPFNPDIQSYTVIVDYSCSSIDVTSSVNGTYPAIIKVQGQVVASGTPKTISLVQGANIVNITVTTEDGLIYPYSLVVVKLADATLFDLWIIPGTLIPYFDPHVTLYSSEVNSDVETVRVRAQASNRMATVTVNGKTLHHYATTIPVIPGLNYIVVRVTAADGLTKDYIVVVNRAMSPAYVTITGTSPLDGAKRVNAKLPITISFDKTIVAGPNFDLISVAHGNSIIPCSYSILGSTLTITPKYGSFGYCRNYTVTIPANAVKGADDSLFASPYSFSFTTGDWTDTVIPQCLSSCLDFNNKRVTLYFNKNLINNIGSDAALKAAVSFAPNKTDFVPLGANDTVKISGSVFTITFEQPLSGKNNVIKIAGSTFKDSAGNVLTDEIITRTFRAW